ncbi:hypothetical protein K469DRAFT_745205 [Zopfia rhizophila CBS 207.26]|uniref:Uncharacterized protein n=1 Tax=Zopfia rhizophila CBS 207.26 TaxID=1314779 RepID=A0A6A6ER09_9PEZI|nr:hypothetical protein K469DRAFT_745205 [Zopfia rhizophila CBS 207.26]
MRMTQLRPPKRSLNRSRMRAKLCDEGICNQRCSNLDICVTGPSVTTPISSISASLATTRPPSSLVTSFSSTAANSTTTSSSVPTRAMDPPGGIPLSNPHSGQYNADQETKEGVFNYYFLFLALFGVVVAVFLWWIHRRKKRRKEQLRLSGQNALARDLDGWVNTRRWMHGGWRHNHTAAFVRREEGLDERGEAPPPYEPKADTAGGQGDAQPVQDSASELTVPLRTLQRDDIERSRPPEYQESVHRSESETVRPDAANTRIT